MDGDIHLLIMWMDIHQGTQLLMMYMISQPYHWSIRLRQREGDCRGYLTVDKLDMLEKGGKLEAQSPKLEALTELH